MSVVLRQRQKTKNGKISLYLDISHKGKRWLKFLKLHLHSNSETGKLNQKLKDENKKTLELAEAIRAKFQFDLYSGEYGITSKNKVNANFIEYFKALTEKRKNSFGNYGNWDSVLKHLQKYTDNKEVTFAYINSKWVQGFEDYLNTVATKKDGSRLSENSKISYFNKLKAALKQATKDEIINKNPSVNIKANKEPDSVREYLTFEEVIKLAKTDCESPIIKKAFLFSCLTGLRHSDLSRLIWKQIEYSKSEGFFIKFVQKKTKGAEKLYIQDQVIKLLGEETNPNDKIFSGLFYSAHNNIILKKWVNQAGIDKHITFHCARHTYATLQLTHGTDLYTVSKLLGHKNLKTTQIYAKVIDTLKREAVDRIPYLEL